MRRGFRLFLALLLLLTLVGGSGIAWLLYSEAGAGWLWSRATGALAGQLSARQVSGSLRHGLLLEDLRYRDESVDLRVARLAITLNPDLFMPAVNLEAVQLDGLRLALLSPATPDESPPIAPRQVLESLQMPLPINVRSLELRDARVTGSDDNVLQTLGRLQLTASLHDSVVIDELVAESAAGRLQLDGRLGLAAPHAVQLDAAADTTIATGAADGATTPVSARLNVTGNLDRLDLVIHSPQRQLTIRGNVIDVDSDPRFDLAATAAELGWPLDSEQPAYQLRDLVIGLNGGLQDYRVELQSAASVPRIDALALQAGMRGNLSSLEVERLELESGPLQAIVSAALNWEQDLVVSSSVDLRRLQLANWLSAWPTQQTLQGKLQSTVTGSRLEIAGLQVSHGEGQALVSGNGVVDLDGGVVDLQLSSRDLQWPLPPDSADIGSPAASLTVSGTPDNWTVAGDVALSTPEVPDGRFSVRGSGTRDRMALDIQQGQVLGGNITGQVEYDWSGGGRWYADLQASDTRVTALFPDWPGRVSTSFTSSGNLSPLRIDVQIASLEGELRSRPIAANGGVHFENGRLDVSSFHIASGESQLTADGSMQAGSGLAFTLDVASLGDFLPGASGQLAAEGVARAGDELPWLELSLDAADLGYAGWHVESLQLVNEPAPDGPSLALSATAERLSQGRQRLQSLSVDLDGDSGRHRLQLALLQGERQLDVVLAGGLQPLTPFADAVWNGELDTLSLVAANGPTLRLRAPATLAVSATRVEAGTVCIDVSDGGSVCGNGHFQPGGSYAATLQLTSLPLNLLSELTDTDLEFSQLLDGQLELATGPAGKLSADGRIDVSPGTINNRFDERLNLRTRAGFAALQLRDGQLLAGEINLPFSDAAELQGRFDVEDIARGQDSPVSGSFKASLRNLGTAARIVPQIDDAGGALNVDLQVDGTLAAPAFSGNATLADGFLVYDPLGLRLDDVQISSEILRGNRVEIRSTFRAGDGRGSLTSSADYLQGRSAGLELALKGEGLRLVDLNDLRVVVDPDLQLGLRDNDISINGRLAVPSARLASVNLVAGGVSESDDVEFVGDEQTERDAAAENASIFNYDGNVTLQLGKDVVVDLDVAEARLRGQSEFSWQGPALPRANGAFNISGKFEAYGQLLEISEGTIRYPDVPATSPELRIRAEREIFGNSQVRRAGVLVTGTALQPQVEVYTTPATSQDRALSLLATGSDFNYEQGVGAVDVGTYIAPRLYASYGIGLFDKENVISVRYDLAKGFGIKATSGTRTAGIDISYTISK